MPNFIGGPLDGQSGFDPRHDQQLPPELMALLQGGQGMGPPAMEAPPGMEAPPEPGLEEDQGLDWKSLPEVQHFQKLIEGARALNDKLDSEQNKLKLEKVTTLLQEIRAADEAEENQMMQGKPSPRMVRRAYANQNGNA